MKPRTLTVVLAMLLAVLVSSIHLPAARSAAGVASATSAAGAAAAVAPTVTSKVVMGDTSVDGPALWTNNPAAGAPAGSPAAVLGWTGTDLVHHLNVMTSGDGLHFGNKRTLAETSATRPAVVVTASGAVAVAWTGTDAGHHLNVLVNAYSATPQKLTLWTQSAFQSPALAYRSGVLWLSWAGVDPGHTLTVMPITLDGSLTAGQPQVLGAFTSVTGPSLTLDPNGNRLLLTWSALSPVNRLQFAVSDTGASWQAPLAVPIGETSGSTPALLGVASGGLPHDFFAWTGVDPGHSLNVRYTEQFPQWPTGSNKSILSETAFGAPALGHVGSSTSMILAWAGTDPAHHLSAATVSTLSLDQRVDNYIAGLSTAQLIGQTLMFGVYANSYNANFDQALTQWHIGSAIVYTALGGGPVQPATLTGLRQLVGALQSHAQTPLLLAIDQEGGTVDRLAPYYGGTPSARQLAATGNPQNAYNQAQTDAGRMRSIGLNVDFAPVVDVDQGGGEGSSRMFGTTASTVTTYAGAFLDGLQQHGVAGTLKHWPGIGAASGNPDLTLPTINKSQAQMNAVDFAPFRSLLSRQPRMIMVTTVMAPAFDAQNPAMLSPTLVNSVLRGQLGYQGVIVTDALDAQGLIQYMSQQGYPNPVQGLAEASVRAFLAGNDLILCPIAQDRLAAVVAAMTQAVASGRISQAQLHAAVHRIIRLKAEMGLLTLP